MAKEKSNENQSQELLNIISTLAKKAENMVGIHSESKYIGPDAEVIIIKGKEKLAETDFRNSDFIIDIHSHSQHTNIQELFIIQENHIDVIFRSQEALTHGSVIRGRYPGEQGSDRHPASLFDLKILSNRLELAKIK